MTGAGKLDTRCTFEKATESSDGGGGITTTWTEQFKVWGSFEFMRLGKMMDKIAAGAVVSSTQAVLIVRASSNMTETITEQNQDEWRVVADSRTWNIRHVPPKVDGFIHMVVESSVPT